MTGYDPVSVRPTTSSIPSPQSDIDSDTFRNRRGSLGWMEIPSSHYRHRIVSQKIAALNDCSFTNSRQDMVTDVGVRGTEIHQIVPNSYGTARTKAISSTPTQTCSLSHNIYGPKAQEALIDDIGPRNPWPGKHKIPTVTWNTEATGKYLDSCEQSILTCLVDTLPEPGSLNSYPPQPDLHSPSLSVTFDASSGVIISDRSAEITQIMTSANPGPAPHGPLTGHFHHFQTHLIFRVSHTAGLIGPIEENRDR